MSEGPTKLVEGLKSSMSSLLRPGIQHEEVVAGYDDWSDNYDGDVNVGWYNSLDITLRQVLRQVPLALRPATRVLDVAAGTGRVGRELHRQGFRHIDAVEPAEGMLKKLRQCGVYTNQFMESVGIGQATAVPSDTYDLVIVSGGMGDGHIPVKGMDDLIRAAKKGGLVMIVMRREFLEIVEAYKDTLEPYMEELERKGTWTKVERRVVPQYYFEHEGVVFIYRVA